MTAYDAYESLLEAGRKNNQGRLEHAAITWCGMGLENPFPAKTEAHEQYFQMKQRHDIWKRGAINMRRSREQMIEAAGKLAALGLPNPYQISMDEVLQGNDTDGDKEAITFGHITFVEEGEAPTDASAESAESVVINEEPEMVFGVVPEKKGYFSRKRKEEEA